MKSRGKAPSQVAEMDQYQTEDDLRTMQRAHEIKRDKKRHKKVKHLARQRLQSIKAIAQGHGAAEATDEDTL